MRVRARTFQVRAKILAISNNVGMYVGQYYKKEYRLYSLFD